MEKTNWGTRIRAFRKLKGYTQESFAKALGISVSVLGEIERGTREPNEDIIQLVTNKLGINKEELFPNK